MLFNVPFCSTRTTDQPLESRRAGSGRFSSPTSSTQPELVSLSPPGALPSPSPSRSFEHLAALNLVCSLMRQSNWCSICRRRWSSFRDGGGAGLPRATALDSCSERAFAVLRTRLSRCLDDFCLSLKQPDPPLFFFSCDFILRAKNPVGLR